MKLTPRLRAVAELIWAAAHADIGADHALLPRYLLISGRAQRVVVVEKHPGPYERSRQALAGYPAEVRLGDGLSALAAGEVDSLSISGMGALAMVAILTAHPERLPERLALQPNDSAEPLRRWAGDSGYHLSQERLVQGYWRYSVLALTRRGPAPTRPTKGYPATQPCATGRYCWQRKTRCCLADLRPSTPTSRRYLGSTKPSPCGRGWLLLKPPCGSTTHRQYNP